ncbi:PAS domain-containing hybrid sensor histidine kinase/response regulator [Parvularcula dongshanensis]|uniref:histidine kinase n=1 Tax=Parvularcula dongshanensis TaxID=1173995 RepID=A0A840I7F1_9PROT|nr:PAS domain-containing hybrid sensor histidine kinase/response regulator [Parvularcula dongshanensis]MBB4660255.1 PAS domain S-box-containing protein [Parvularcula dongshanensis]
MSAIEKDNHARSLSDVKSYAVCMLDPVGIIQTWNTGAARIKGYSADQIVGQHFSCFYPHEGQVAREPQKALEEAIKTGEYEAQGWRIRRDGQLFWASVVISPNYDDNGELIGFIKITRDCSAERDAHEALSRSERSFRLLVQGVTDYAIYMLDRDGRVASWNAGAERAKGYEADEIIGRHFSCFYPPDSQATGDPAQALETSLRTGTFEAEGWRVRKDGTRFWAMVVIDPVYDEDGTLMGFAKITKDCTERNEAEKTALETAEGFRRLVEGVTDYAIYMLDPGGHVQNWNEGAQRAKGYEASEIVGRHFSAFYAEEDREAGLPQKALAEAREKGKFEAQGWRYRKDGTRFWASVVIDPIYHEGELLGFAKITRDFTDQKQSQEKVERLLEEQRETSRELEVALEVARAASVAKSAFLANMSHEIRTPMNGVLGMAELLVQAELGARERMFAETIYKSGNALLTVINDVLDFSKIEAGKIELDPVPFDLRGAVEDVATLLAATAHEKGIEIAVRCDPALPAMVEGDAGRFRQIITNLAGNAVKFTPEGHVLICVVPGADRNWRVEVTDTGIGIPADKLDSIFDEFAQVEETTTRDFGGTGLGLAITRRLVQLMGGEVGVNSKLSKGSTFWIELPLSAANDAEAVPRGEAKLYGRKVLLVDDVSINLDILEEHCVAWGLTCVRAESGAEAIALLEQAADTTEPFEAVLLDYHMPEMDGLAVAEHIANTEALDPTKIIVLSSVDNDIAISAFRAHGASDYLIKPVRSGQLYTVLTSAFGLKGPVAAKTKRRTGKAPAEMVAAEVPRRRVLVAEDNEVNQLVLQNLLGEDHYEFTFADDGAAAYDAFCAGQFDVVLMDLSMPKMDGMESTKHIRAYETKKGTEPTPIICLSAHALASHRERCLAAGMNDYLSKPIKADELREMIDRWAPGQTGQSRRNRPRRARSS